MPHRRRITKGLNTNEVKELDQAWRFASFIRRPLNAMVTIRPINIDEMSPAERCQVFLEVRNKLGVFARGRRLPITFAWTRESNLDGTGEHMHVLIHMPARHREKFDELVTGWFPGPGEADITTATQKVRFTWDGKRLTAINYITKQMTPQAWYRRGLIRKKGGPIFGKRSGVTRDINWQSRAKFWEDRRKQPIYAFSLPPVRHTISENIGGVG